MPYQAILFDMDGTLIDSEHLHIRAWQQVLLPYDLHFEADWFEQWIGISDISFSQTLTKEYRLDQSGENLLLRKRTLFRQLARTELTVLTGVAEGLTALPPVPKVVVTSSNREDALMSLQTTGLWSQFIGLVSIDDVIHPKPHPEPYHVAANLTSTPTASCVALEDSVSGVRSAKAAGCFTVAVANSVDQQMLRDADLVFENTREAMFYLSQPGLLTL